jgi:hypothetical protein
MIDLGFLLLLAFWAWWVGRAILARLADAPGHPADAVALALPLGLGALSLAAFALGSVGGLSPPGLALVFFLGVVLGAFPRRRRRASDPPATIDPRPSAIPDANPDRPAPRLLGLAFDLALAATALGTLLVAMTPVTDGDALCYHLQVPRVFLDAHGTRFEPDLHETVYPLVAEMLYAVALAFRGPVACRLLHWLFGLVLAANVSALARPILGRDARWAGAIALAVPAVSNGMAAPLNDVALAAFANASLFALARWWTRPTPGGAVLVGVLAGLAIGVKYPALVWAALLGAAMLARGRVGGMGRAQAVRHFARFVLATLLVGGCWYARAFAHTGNPVYPYFRGVFGAGLDEVLEPSWRPLAITPWNLVTALAPLTLQPERFDSLAHQFGPVFLLLVPGLALIRSPARARALAVFGLAFLGLCLTQRQSMRFVLAALGPLAVGSAWLVRAWWSRGVAGRAIVALIAAVVLGESALALGRARNGLGVVSGRETPEAYLARREPTWRVGRWIDANLPASARVVGQDHRGFYLPRPYTMELAHRRRTGLGRRGESAEAIVAALRGRGFTHLLLCPPEPEDAVEFDPTLSRRLAPWLATQAPLFDEPIGDADGVVRRYAIYDLTTATRTADAGESRR